MARSTTSVLFTRRCALTSQFFVAWRYPLCLYSPSKHRQNLVNLAANEGHEAFNEGAEIQPPRTYQVHEKRQKEPTIDEDNDLEWAGTISIGTPAQNFLIDFDSKYSFNASDLTGY